MLGDYLEVDHSCSKNGLQSRTENQIDQELDFPNFEDYQQQGERTQLRGKTIGCQLEEHFESSFPVIFILFESESMIIERIKTSFTRSLFFEVGNHRVEGDQTIGYIC